MSGRAFAGVVLALVLSVVSGARAQGPAEATGGMISPSRGARLEWRAPVDCPTQRDVLARVAGLSNDDRLRWDRFEVIRGVIERGASSWSLALEFVGQGAVRRRALESRSCAELGEAAAVAIVLAHRGNEEAPEKWDAAPPPKAREASDPPTNDMAAVSPALPAPAVPAGGTPAETPVRSWREPTPVKLGATAELALDPTTLGTAAFGAAIGMELGLGVFSTALYAAGFPSATTRLAAGQSIALGLWAGGLRGCYRWGRGLDTCLMVEVGQVTAEGVGLAEAGASRDLWAAPGLSVGFESTPFDGFGITTRLSAFHPLVRGSYWVDDGELVHRLPGVGFRAALGVDLPLL